MRNVLSEKLGKHVSELYSIEFEIIEDNAKKIDYEICVMEVTESTKAVFLKGGSFCARVGNRTQFFNTEEAHQYITKKKWRS